METLAIVLAYWVIGLSCVFSVAGFFGRYNWLLDLCSHFRLQYLIVLIAGALWLAFNGHILWTVVLLSCLVANLPQVLPFYPSPRVSRPDAISSGVQAPTTLRLLHINVLYRTWDYQRVLNYIDRQQPEVLSLHEMNARWLEHLEAPLRERFPHAIINHAAESALFSTLPFAESELCHLRDPAEDFLSGVLIARIHKEGVPFTVMVTHTYTPVSPNSYRMQLAHFAAVGKLVRHDPAENLLLVGDFNTTPFSHAYRELMRTSGLRDARMGFGLRPTWPIYIPVALIPLDHCLYRGNVTVKKYALGALTWSDHLPIELTLEF